MKPIVITGAAGFIASHLCEATLAAGRTVYGVNAFSAHYARELKEINLQPALAHKRFSFHELDILDPALEELVGQAKWVFHLAARPGVRDSWEDFADYDRANVLGTRAVLDACARHGVRLIYASSSSVYGDAGELPVKEDSSLRPVSPYGATKAMTELLAGAYASAFGLHAVGLRYFTVYGPRQRPDMGLARFIEAVAAGEPLRIFGDGRQLRDMTYVGDAVAATLAAAEQGRAGAVYNVSCGTPRSLLEILTELEEALGQPLALEHEQRKAGDVRDTWGALERAREDLGYEPSVSLREGLRRQIAEAARRREALTGQIAQEGPRREALTGQIAQDEPRREAVAVPRPERP